MTATYLRLDLLALDSRHGVGVALETVDLCLGSHVPHASDRVSAGAHQYVERGMERERVAGAQMTMVVTNDLVGLQVPALDLLVLATREQVGVTWADADAPHRAHVASQGELECARGQVPDLRCHTSR